VTGLDATILPSRLDATDGLPRHGFRVCDLALSWMASATQGAALARTGVSQSQIAARCWASPLTRCKGGRRAASSPEARRARCWKRKRAHRSRCDGSFVTAKEISQEGGAGGTAACWGDYKARSSLTMRILCG